jgi:hypothetical protein
MGFAVARQGFEFCQDSPRQAWPNRVRLLRTGRPPQVASHLCSHKRSYHCWLQGGNVTLMGTYTPLFKRLHRRTGPDSPWRGSVSTSNRCRNPNCCQSGYDLRATGTSDRDTESARLRPATASLPNCCQSGYDLRWPRQSLAGLHFDIEQVPQPELLPIRLRPSGNWDQ